MSSTPSQAVPDPTEELDDLLRDLSNHLLLWGIAFELIFPAAIVWVPPLQGVFGTRPPDPVTLVLLPGFPLVGWAVDAAVRRTGRRAADYGAGRRRGPDGLPVARI